MRHVFNERQRAPEDPGLTKLVERLSLSSPTWR